MIDAFLDFFTSVCISHFLQPTKQTHTHSSTQAHKHTSTQAHKHTPPPPQTPETIHSKPFCWWFWISLLIQFINCHQHELLNNNQYNQHEFSSPPEKVWWTCLTHKAVKFLKVFLTAFYVVVVVVVVFFFFIVCVQSFALTGFVAVTMIVEWTRPSKCYGEWSNQVIVVICFGRSCVKENPVWRINKHTATINFLKLIFSNFLNVLGLVVDGTNKGQVVLSVGVESRE